MVQTMIPSAGSTAPRQPAGNARCNTIIASLKRILAAAWLLTPDIGKAWALEQLYLQLSVRSDTDLARLGLRREDLARYIWTRFYAEASAAPSMQRAEDGTGLAVMSAVPAPRAAAGRKSHVVRYEHVPLAALIFTFALLLVGFLSTSMP